MAGISPRLSTDAVGILERMEQDRAYGPDDLRALAPATSIEHLRDIMHELWIGRQVERIGYPGWRRHPSGPVEAANPRQVPPKVVRPEELFDHDAFAEFFK